MNLINGFDHEEFIRLCAEHHYGVEEIASETSLSPSTVSRWFKGEAAPYPSFKTKLAMVLECDIADIFPTDKNIAPAEPQKAPAKKTTVSPEGVKPANEPPQKKPQQTKNTPKENPAMTNTPEPAPVEEVKPAPSVETKKSTAEKPAATKPVSEKADRAVPQKPIAEPTPAPTSVKAVTSDAPKTKDDILRMMKETKFDIKSVNKNMTPADMSAWLEAYTKDASEKVLAITTSVSEVTSAMSSLFASAPAVNPKYTALLKAAETSTDEAIALAITILKKVK